MNEFKGTPGPLVASKTGRGIGPVSGLDDQSFGMIIEVAYVEFYPDTEIQAANAQLIASAPELLEALATTLDEIGHWLSQQKPDLKEKIDSAITKALGESQ